MDTHMQAVCMLKMIAVRRKKQLILNRSFYPVRLSAAGAAERMKFENGLYRFVTPGRVFGHS